MKKFIAFTLSEVLVTLGIIGVVSALTIPTMMKNHQRHINVVQLKKVYSELSQALQEAIIEKKAVSLSEAGAFDDGAEAFFNEHFEKSKICGDTWSEVKNCFAEKYKKIDGTKQDFSGGGTGFASAVLASGAVIGITPEFPNESSVIVDTNGKQGPNIAGRDFFIMKINNSGKISSYHEYGNGHSNTISATTALSKIIQDGWEMNY